MKPIIRIEKDLTKSNLDPKTKARFTLMSNYIKIVRSLLIDADLKDSHKDPDEMLMLMEIYFDLIKETFSIDDIDYLLSLAYKCDSKDLDDIRRNEILKQRCFIVKSIITE